MELALKGSVAFIAGSSQGIGRAIAGSFLGEGARVVVTGRRQELVDRTTAEFKKRFDPESIHAFAGDLTDSATIRGALQQVIERWGSLETVVANIGSGSSRVNWSSETADWSDVFELNFFSATRLLKEAIPLLEKSGRGSVVIVNSIAGVEATSAPLAYSSAKAALLSYGKNLSRQIASMGIRVNIVAPGNILFPGGSWEKSLQQRPEEVGRYIESEVPLARFGTPEEIADFVVFLSSPKAAFATGACVVVDGGQTRTI